MDGYGTYAENFAVNWLETNYIVHFAENYIEELTVQDVADFPQTLFGWGLARVKYSQTAPQRRPSPASI